jgi:hypothetical protein
MKNSNEYNYLRDVFILCLLGMFYIQDFNIKQQYRFTNQMFDFIEERQTLNFNYMEDSDKFQYKILNYLLIQETGRNINED